MKLLDMTKKYGKATYKYPFEPYEVPENYRGKPNYTYDLCIGCAACGVACPSNAIELKLNDTKDRLVWKFDAGRCIFCGRCDEVCPTGAVMLSSEFELAVKFDKSALMQQGELVVAHCKCCGKPFTTKRLIDYALERMQNANLPDDRLEEAKEYVYYCVDCKKQHTVSKFCKEGGEVIK